MDHERTERRGSKYQAIRTNLNRGKNYQSRIVSIPEAINHLKMIQRDLNVDWQISEKFTFMETQRKFFVSTFDEQENLSACAGCYYTRDLINIEYLLAAPGSNSLKSRWILHEKIVDIAVACSFKYLRISKPLDISRKNLFFNRRLGYQDFNFQ